MGQWKCTCSLLIHGGINKMARVIAVSNNKGGILKTTISVTLATLLARHGNRVLIMDTDNQGNSYLSFGGNPDELDYSMFDVLMGDAGIKDTIINISDNLDVLPSNDSMEFFDMDVL